MSPALDVVLAFVLAAGRRDPAQVGTLLSHIAAVILIVTGMALGLGWIMRQGHRGSADAKRLRSIVTFDAVVPVEGVAGLGALVTPIVASLRQSGLDVGDPEAGENAAHVPLELEHDQFVVHVRRAPDHFVVQLCDRSAANRPPSESRGAPVGRKRTRRVLVALDVAVRGLPTATQVRWHKRERFDAGDHAGGGHDAIE